MMSSKILIKSLAISKAVPFSSADGGVKITKKGTFNPPLTARSKSKCKEDALVMSS